MKTLAFVTMHYGAAYLETALRSLDTQVDQFLILYAAKPSQGYQANIPCPDTRQDLWEITRPWKHKLTWVDGEWPDEGSHHNTVFQFAAGFDWLWRFDTDEVAQPGLVAEMIAQAEETGHRFYRVPFIHHWRSFDKACRDSQMPMRLIRVNGGEGESVLNGKDYTWNVHHMGYAQPLKYIAYKLLVSGHRPEFRENWLQEIYLGGVEKDVHPVSFGLWNVEPYDKTKMPKELLEHPLYGVDPIL